jgi:hypothetical protein|tara:strand:- start:2409 stop:3422 length:1014 start_codon:yes stop_codon:yes gene_type:complete
MGIFKNITKTLKKAAPLIGSTIGFAIGGPTGAAIGSGIGSLASGRSVEDALLNAGLAYGVGSFAKGAGFDTGTGSGAERFLPSYEGDAAFGFGTMAPANEFAGLGASGGPTAIKTVDSGGIGSFFKDNMGKIALGGAALGALSGEEEKDTSPFNPEPYAVGKTRLGTGRIGDKLYNLDNEEELERYKTDNRKRRGEQDIFMASEGGMAEADFYDPGINETRSPLEKMSTKQLIASKGQGKEGFTEAGIRAIQNELNKRRAPKVSMSQIQSPENLMRSFMGGGEVEGPGTGTSDSVPARLSDGEFVVTAKAVRGAGGGDRNVGAARMYDMMSQLERVA